jgi:hypothetical protein
VAADIVSQISFYSKTCPRVFLMADIVSYAGTTNSSK